MRILALEPYDRGSHRAFLHGWASASRHRFTLVTLPGRHWKWRMRHASWTLADETTRRVEAGERWDAVVCSDMLNLPEWRGLAPAAVRTLPAVAYFHENQPAYPDPRWDKRDLHFAFTNFATALAGEPWFNSAWHRDVFRDRLADLLKAMPDHRDAAAVEAIRSRARVLPPGIDPPEARPPRRAGPLRIGWAARWEHDKDPATFFAALDDLDATGVDFRLSVMGESFGAGSRPFREARCRWADRIDHWGFLPRDDYRRALAEIDVIVSTALHEFWGLSVVEAAAAGVMPVVPRRLAYPEVFGLGEEAGADDLFYNGDRASLAAKLAALAARLNATGTVWTGDPDRVRRRVERWQWPRHAPVLDDAVEALVRGDAVRSGLERK
ncbi:MAG: tRNA-queuosine alpha-mannosyltransferase domain-containing protein [Planctomycetota bacterium]